MNETSVIIALNGDQYEARLREEYNRGQADSLIMLDGVTIPTAETARILGCSEQTIRRYVAEGLLNLVSEHRNLRFSLRQVVLLRKELSQLKHKHRAA